MTDPTHPLDTAPARADGRDPHAWAIYVRTGDVDGRMLLAAVERLAELVARRGGHVAGIYADVGPAAGPEFAVLLGHATRNRFAHVAVVHVDALGVQLDGVALSVMCLYDLGVELVGLWHAGEIYPDGHRLSLDDVGRDLRGAGATGRTIVVITNTVGTPPGGRRGDDPDDVDGDVAGAVDVAEVEA